MIMSQILAAHLLFLNTGVDLSGLCKAAARDVGAFGTLAQLRKGRARAREDAMVIREVRGPIACPLPAREAAAG